MTAGPVTDNHLGAGHNKGHSDRMRPSMREPSPEGLQSPFLLYFLATRPPFLAATIVPVILGLALTIRQGNDLQPWLAAWTLLAASLLHAAANVVNDYFDAINGTDTINHSRLYPFTGGSRFIQNGALTLRATRRYAILLTTAVAVIGTGLMARTGPSLAITGLAGLFLAWAYSAPPFRLNSRGLGELCVLAGFGLLPLGTLQVQGAQPGWPSLLAALPLGLLITNLLFINQFPDRTADGAVGKHHWVSRLSPEQARWGYPVIGLAAYGILVGAVQYGPLPTTALWGLFTSPLTAAAAAQLSRYANQTDRLRPAIILSLVAALGHGLLLAGGLALA